MVSTVAVNAKVKATVEGWHLVMSMSMMSMVTMMSVMSMMSMMSVELILLWDTVATFRCRVFYILNFNENFKNETTKTFKNEKKRCRSPNKW